MNLQDLRLEISAIQLPCNDSSLHDEVFLHKILNPQLLPMLCHRCVGASMTMCRCFSLPPGYKCECVCVQISNVQSLELWSN